MTCKIAWGLVPIFVLALVLIIIREKKVICECSFMETKQLMFAYLGTSEEDMLDKKNPVYTTQQAPVADLIGYGVRLSSNEDMIPKKVSIVCTREYNIGASGGQTICFEISPVDETHTQITVAYTEQWVGMWPPFVFWSPGIIMRQRLADSIDCFIRARVQPARETPKF